MTVTSDDLQALLNRGHAARRAKQFSEALVCYDQVLAAEPKHIEALRQRGDALAGLKRFDDAIATYDRALSINPDDPDALKNRGDALSRLGKFKDAVTSYDRALAVRPDSVEVLSNRAEALRRANRFDDALASIDRALALQPDSVHALAARAAVMLIVGKPGEAVASSRKALAIAPSDPHLHTHVIFALNFDPSASAADKQAERARWDARHAGPLASAIKPHTNDPDPKRRIRVGYVSSHFLRQAATYAFGGVVLNHDPKLFDVVCYSDSPREDDVTDLIRSRVGQFHRTAHLSDEQLAELIRSHRVDILVDLVGHMAGHRLRTFARKPAPIQVTGWGEPTGTGLKAMDYLLADAVLVPESERTLLAERVVNLPNFLGYWQPEQAPEPGPLPALANGFVTFGSFNRLEKLTDRTIAVWASILRKVPTAHLLLKTRPLVDPKQRARIIAAFAREGVPAKRLTLLGRLDRVSHFNAYQKIDIALDTFPHGGGMTTLDALTMGVPVVTWPGETISSRLAAATLTALGLTDFVAASPDAYVDLAVAKASDIEGLSRLRATLRGRLADSAFGNSERYCRAVESAYRDMWQHWCAAQTSGA